MKKNSFFKRLVLPAACAAVLMSGAGTVMSHHPIMGKFDTQQQTTLNGRVTYVDWRNPHAHVFINVMGAEGMENWAVELESPVILQANGWDAQSLMPGDEISVQGMLARDGTRQIWGSTVNKAGSGVVYAVNMQSERPSTGRPAPRWPDGQVALGITGPNQDGYWGFPSKTSLVEDGVNVQVDRYGMLNSLDDAGRVAPFQPWALGLYRSRQQRSLQDDPMFQNCKPPGGPRQYQSELGFQLLEDKENQRVFVMIGSGNRNFRIIYMDSRDQLGQVGGDDDNPLYYGRSRGRWEGDTLVVNTAGFNEDFWFSNGGLPHTDRLEMEERFTRTDFDTLQYQVTINDTGAYTRPWTVSWTLGWVDGEDLPVHFCQHNRQ
jgi:hypothetical protein